MIELYKVNFSFERIKEHKLRQKHNWIGQVMLSIDAICKLIELINEEDESVWVYFPSKSKGKYHRLLVSYKDEDTVWVEYMTSHIYSKLVGKQEIPDLMSDANKFSPEYFLKQKYKEETI